MVHPLSPRRSSYFVLNTINSSLPLPLLSRLHATWQLKGAFVQETNNFLFDIDFIVTFPLQCKGLGAGKLSRKHVVNSISNKNAATTAQEPQGSHKELLHPYTKVVL